MDRLGFGDASLEVLLPVMTQDRRRNDGTAKSAGYNLG
jgi:hypothetical protein